jgi:CheY-like chemotaxis protein
VLLLEQDERFAVVGRARDGREAVELGDHLSPDAVVMDIEMPVLDGVEATKRIRTETPELPIVAVSGHDYEERVLEIRQAGANDYVRKARLADELLRVLLALLENATVKKEQILEVVRAICLGLPETSERPSHGEPTFFVRGKRSFATVWDSHHGDGRFALICAAPAGMQAVLVEADAERFYVPPYVGHRGWIGVRLDRDFDRGEIAGIVEDAYAEVAPPKLVEAARREE